MTTTTASSTLTSSEKIKMPSDVFGRPMNTEPTTFQVRRPMAPNPLDPGPQDAPLGNMGGNYSPAGESGAFGLGQAESESLGARQHIAVSRRLGPGPSPMEAPGFNHSMDGQLMPKKMP